MRHVAALALFAACDPGLAARPLPELVVSLRPVVASSGALWIVPGEHLVWQVSSGELTIGRAELVTRELEIESRFATDGFASMFAEVHHELTTPIAGGDPCPAGSPAEWRCGSVAHGLRVHTLHSALAWLRAWAPRDQAPALLDVELGDERYRLACQPPMADELHDARVDRIACEIDGRAAIAVTLWLSTDRARVPVRVLAKTGTFHLVGELVAR
jgi:hypothetical protein